MVLFVNVNIGQRVEVKWKNRIVPGTVKYKGGVNRVAGDWVGVALDASAGSHDGTLNGRRYFQCLPRHGIFTTASKIRFMALKRCLFNKYHTVDPESIIEEDLFGLEKPTVTNGPYDPISVSLDYPERAQSAFGRPTSSLFEPSKSHQLRHSVSRYIPPVTPQRPKTARLSSSCTSLPVHTEIDRDQDLDFISYPSIPKTHMPHSALKRQVRWGWDGVHYVREMSVHNGRDSLKRSQWNDISE